MDGQYVLYWHANSIPCQHSQNYQTERIIIGRFRSIDLCFYSKWRNVTHVENNTADKNIAHVYAGLNIKKTIPLGGDEVAD